MPRKSAKSGPIRTAVISLGRAGWDIHIKQLRNDRRYGIVGVCDPIASRRAEAAAELGCEAFDDHRKMLRGSDAELVVVASPSSMHAEHVVAAFAGGSHVVVEKPLAMTVRQVDRMIAAARAARRKLMVHQNHRFGRLFAFLDKTIRSGKLGRVFHIGRVAHSYWRRCDWQCLSRYGGGVLNNHGSHALDLMLALARSKVTAVLCDMRHVSDAGDVEDHVKLLAKTAGGITLDLEISTAAATTRSGPAWTVLGTCGALTIDAGRAHLKYFDPKKVKPLRIEPAPAAANRKYVRHADLPWRQVECKAEAPAGGGFYDAVHQTLRRGKAFAVRPAEVRQVVRVIELARRQNRKFAFHRMRRR